MKVTIRELIIEAKRLGLGIGRGNGRYSVGTAGDYAVDKVHFDTMREVRAYLIGYEERMDEERRNAKV